MFNNGKNSKFWWHFYKTVIYTDNFGIVEADWHILTEAKQWKDLLEFWQFEHPDLILECSTILNSEIFVDKSNEL